MLLGLNGNARRNLWAFASVKYNHENHTQISEWNKSTKTTKKKKSGDGEHRRRLRESFVDNKISRYLTIKECFGLQIAFLISEKKWCHVLCFSFAGSCRIKDPLKWLHLIAPPQGGYWLDSARRGERRGGNFSHFWDSSRSLQIGFTSWKLRRTSSRGIDDDDDCSGWSEESHSIHHHHRHRLLLTSIWLFFLGFDIVCCWWWLMMSETNGMERDRQEESRNNY